MYDVSLGGVTRMRTAAFVGWLLAMIASALSLPTILSLHGSVRLNVCLVFFCWVAMASLMLVLPWERLCRMTLLVWPLGLLVTVATAGLVTPARSVVTLSGLTVVAFFYVGRFLPRGTGLVLVPFAFGTLLACYGGWNSELGLRVPITIGVWITVSESLARMSRHSQQLTEALTHQATTDSLTGLATRQVLTERLAQANAGDAVVILDLDHFKEVNDRYGHLAGDAILSDLGRLLASTIRQADLAVRFGGEELVLLLGGAGTAGAKRILVRIRESWQADHPQITFSAGIAVIDESLDTTGALIAADQALYSAKNLGRDRWEFAGHAEEGEQEGSQAER